MPYVTKEERRWLNEALSGLLGKHDLSPGQLNYLITTILVDQYMEQESYTKFNELMGVLECVKQELYRRRVAPYEDKKKELNGDVYE
jgi:hypothetical protein